MTAMRFLREVRTDLAIGSVIAFHCNGGRVPNSLGAYKVGGNEDKAAPNR